MRYEVWLKIYPITSAQQSQDLRVFVILEGGEHGRA